jgi:hypothetical protein
MKNLLNILSWVGLALTLLPSILLLTGTIESDALVNTLMAAGMVIWFLCRILRETLFRPTEVSEHAVEPESPHTL